VGDVTPIDDDRYADYLAHGGDLSREDLAVEIRRIIAEQEANPVNYAGLVLAVCGIEREMALSNPFTEGANLHSGGDVEQLRHALGWMEAKEKTAAVISFGLAGGLDPALKVGEVVCARAIHDGERLYPTDPEWLALLASRTGARVVDCVFGSDVLAATPRMKAAMFAATGAATVDMESQEVARWAARQNIPTAVLRVVSDGSRHTLPSSAAAGMGADGKIDVGAVLRELARRPYQLPALIRTSFDVEHAFRSLKRAAEAAGQYLAFPDERVWVKGEPPLREPAADAAP
jgi:adenosylhomocysteine nucleosidase